MRNLIFLAAVLVSVASLATSQTYAQSGSRPSAGGGSSSIGGGGGSSFGGGGSSFGGGSSSFGRRRISPAERQQQLEQQRAIAAENARIQTQVAKQQYKQSLVQLGLRTNSGVNSAQYRIAFNEAKDSYRALRAGQVDPTQLGSLRSPFRLPRKEINRNERTANWPSVLQTARFESQVQSIDSAIMGNTIMDASTATQFLSEIDSLNVALNRAAASGQINIGDYARARRFVDGIANEVRITDLVM